MLVHWIWLAQRKSLKDWQRYALVQHFSNPEAIFYADDFAGSIQLDANQVEELKDKDLQSAENILEVCKRERIHVLTMQDAAYPARLKNISDPPVVLYYKGNLPDLDGLPVIGVVGTRHASAYGMKIAKRMGYQIGACGGVVVSGVATGIDSVAMQGALSAGQSVVGVLGCGADVVYPVSARGLYADTERYGCLISEYPPGTPPHKWNFPKRNRIISGLSDGVLVVEAPAKSGALITARHAADQGRDVFVTPGTVDNPQCEGSNALLRDGAISVSNGWELMSEYEDRYPGKIRRSRGGDKLPIYPEEMREFSSDSGAKVAQKVAMPGKTAKNAEKNTKKTIDKEEIRPYSDGNDKKPALTENEQALVRLLTDGEQLVDDVIAASPLSPGLVLATLTMLEVKGVVKNLPGRRVALKKQNH